VCVCVCVCVRVSAYFFSFEESLIFDINGGRALKKESTSTPLIVTTATIEHPNTKVHVRPYIAL
jgi:hypothetical protein